jgi:hypothetical protein
MKFKKAAESLGVIALAIVAYSIASGEVLAQKPSLQDANRMAAEANARCNNQFPDPIKQAVARAACENKSMEPMRAFMPYPDLMDQELANNLLLAEKVQRGKMTPIERQAATAQFHSGIFAESERRRLANRTVRAQESAAGAAPQVVQPGVVVVEQPQQFRSDAPVIQNNLPQRTRCQSMRVGNFMQTVCN